MAIPVKEHVRESRIYFLVSTESVPPDNQTVQRKYLIFKTVELVSWLVRISDELFDSSSALLCIPNVFTSKQDISILFSKLF